MALTQAYTGRPLYYARHETPTGRLTVAVEYEVEEQRVLSLLDTGARVPAQRVVGIFPADLADTLGYDPPAEGVPTVLDTCLGKYQGYLLRIPIFIPAAEGNGLDVELTWIVVPGWPGPPVMGWGGCLERLRLALDPSQGEECFYFGPMSE